MLRAALVALIALAACAEVPPPEVAPPDPVVAGDSPRAQPLVIATDAPPGLVLRPEPVPAAASCALQAPARAGSRCRPLFPLQLRASGGADSAERAFDGDTCTLWNANDFAPQSIVVDLGAATDIHAIVLVPEMTPNGTVVHRIEVSDDGKTFSPAHRIEAFMQTGVPVELVLPKPERSRFIRVSSEKSPSWIAWREIGLFQCAG